MALNERDEHKGPIAQEGFDGWFELSTWHTLEPPRKGIQIKHCLEQINLWGIVLIELIKWRSRRTVLSILHWLSLSTAHKTIALRSWLQI